LVACSPEWEKEGFSSEEIYDAARIIGFKDEETYNIAMSKGFKNSWDYRDAMDIGIETYEEYQLHLAEKEKLKKFNEDVQLAVDLTHCKNAINVSTASMSNRLTEENKSKALSAGRIWGVYKDYLTYDIATDEFKKAYKDAQTKSNGTPPDGLLYKIYGTAEFAYNFWSTPGNCPSAKDICDKASNGEITKTSRADAITKQCFWLNKE
jgi:hypothetical protein